MVSGSRGARHELDPVTGRESRSRKWIGFGFVLLLLCGVGGYYAYLRVVEMRGRHAVGATLSCVTGEPVVPEAGSLDSRFFRDTVESVSTTEWATMPEWPRRCARELDALVEANEDYREVRFTPLIDPALVDRVRYEFDRQDGSPENSEALVDALWALDDALPAAPPLHSPAPRPEPMEPPPDHGELPSVTLPFSDYRVLSDLGDWCRMALADP